MEDLLIDTGSRWGVVGERLREDGVGGDVRVFSATVSVKTVLAHARVWLRLWMGGSKAWTDDRRS